MILLVDNYDSFSYNLVQEIGRLYSDICVVRNDEITVEEIRERKPSHIILSPGPGYPAQAGICEEVVKKLGREIPILGVCLGHQAICEAYGGAIVRAERLMHGKQSDITVNPEDKLFLGLQRTIKAARYHSLIAQKESLPEELCITATAENGEIMAVRHASAPVYGLQFHPESILTPDGTRILENFLKI